MIKKILSFSFVFLLGLSLLDNDAYAKEGYVPHLEPVYLGPIVGHKETSVPVPELTDGNLDKRVSLEPYDNFFWYDYGEKVDVYSLYNESTDGKGSVYADWIFYDEDLNEISRRRLTNSVTNFTLPEAVRNVRYFAMKRNSSSFTYQIAEIGTVVKYIEYPDVENLLLVPEHDEVSMSWKIPKENPNFTGSKIYRNGVFIDSTDEITNVYVDNDDLEPNTVYSYKITAVYKNGRETQGVTGSTTTLEKPIDPSEIPPSNVTNLVAKDITGTSARLTWENSEDLDLSKVSIYSEDHTLLTSIDVVSEYTISNLNPETTYKFYVALVDVDGNVSSKMPVTFTTVKDIDVTPPEIPKGLTVDGGSNSLYVKWDKNQDSDLAGYNIYVDGVKHNSVLIKNVFYAIPSLVNDQSYSISLTAVDKTGNESDFTTAVAGTPVESGLPILETSYELKDVAVGIESWFSSFWLIIAFSISIPLSFIIASRVKLMFID